MTTTDQLIFAQSNLIIAAIANDAVSWIFAEWFAKMLRKALSNYREHINSK